MLKHKCMNNNNQFDQMRMEHLMLIFIKVTFINNQSNQKYDLLKHIYFNIINLTYVSALIYFIK
jgi:hypothetical protein